MGNKFIRILLIPVITAVGYLFNDDPNPDPKFANLDFVGKMKYYYRQIMREDEKD